MVDLFGSVSSVMSWAFRHQSHNPYGMTWLGKNVVTPDLEPMPNIIPHEDLEHWGPDDFKVVSSKCISECKQKVGQAWPIIVLGFDSYTPARRLQAAMALHKKISRSTELYPKVYFLMVVTTWRITSKTMDKVLISLANEGQHIGHKKRTKRQIAEDLEIATRTERAWRERITGKLDTMFERVMKSID